MKIDFNTVRADDVEYGISVRFVRVVTVPVIIDGREATAYIGVTSFGAMGAKAANSEDIVVIAESLKKQ